MIRVGVALALLALAAPAFGQSRDFRIGGEAYSEADIVDGRALPSLGGSPVIMLTFSETAAARLAAVSRKLTGKPMPVTLDGKTLMEPVVREPLLSGEVQISGLALTLQEATALARRISGKDPLPDSLEE